MTTPAPTGALSDAVADAEHVGEAARLRRAGLVALFAWPAFGLVDLYIVIWVQPGRLWLYWLLRFVGLLVLVPAVVRLQRAPTPSRRLLRLIDIGITTVMSLLVTISCVELGGIASPLALGIITILLARSAIISDHFRRALVPVGAATLVHPLGLLVMAAFVPSMRGQLDDSTTVAVFVLHQIFVFGAALLTLVGGHVVWALRRQVFESRSLGRYELRDKIGEGGMGEVWSALDKKLRREVALKLLRPSNTSENASERFEREIRATSELAHPNTVRVFDHGVTDDGIRYYVMERLYGHDLAALVEDRGPISIRRGVELVRQTASALAEAHGRGIVHRDLKPENIFVARIAGREFVKVLDFGLAHAEDDVVNTREGWACGSPNYIAPEVLRGEKADARSDVYALGCVLYHVLCGRPPFGGRGVRAILLAHLSLEPDPPSLVRGERIPARVLQILMRCMHKHPRRRYGDASELLDALTRCVRSPRIREVTHLTADPTAWEEPAALPAAAEPPTRWRIDPDDAPTNVIASPPTRAERPPPRVPRPRATIPPVPQAQPRWARNVIWSRDAEAARHAARAPEHVARIEIRVPESIDPRGAGFYHEVTLDVTGDPAEEITAVDSREPTFH